MYLITVKTVGGEILTFHAQKYERNDGHIVFIDKYGQEKSFPASDTNIEEVGR